MNLGSRFDVSNTIPFGSAYPGGRSSGYAPPSANRFNTRNNYAGEFGAVNADASAQIMPQQMNGMNGTNGNGAIRNVNGIFGKPANWWIGFLIVFALFIWASKRFNGGEKFTNIKMTVYNGIFLTVFIVLILNFLKVLAARFPIPGLSALILAA